MVTLKGDITEVFDQVRQLKHGVLVRAAHDRRLDQNSEVSGKRKARVAKLAVRFSKVQLRVPYRFDNRDPLQVYAVYATEIDSLGS